jgi:DNA polymerase I-like protein with 3'-5' exonuclease and polymerase domains
MEFELVLQVHDELIAQVVKKHAIEASEIMAETMRNVMKPYMDIPSDVDVEIFESWGGKEWRGDNA